MQTPMYYNINNYIAIGYHLYEFSSSGLSHYDDLAGAIISDYIIPNHYKLGSSVDDFNFGLIDFEWGSTKESSKLTVGIHDIKDVTRLETTISYKDLIYSDAIIDELCEWKFNSRFRPLNEYVSYYSKNKSVLILYLGMIYSVYNIIRFLLFILRLISKIFNCCSSRKLKTD